jgi:hypothetical protein
MCNISSREKKHQAEKTHETQIKAYLKFVCQLIFFLRFPRREIVLTRRENLSQFVKEEDK